MKAGSFKASSLQQIEEQFTAAITNLTGTRTVVNLEAVKDISDGVDRLIGQERYKIRLTLVTQILEDTGKIP